MKLLQNRLSVIKGIRPVRIRLQQNSSHLETSYGTRCTGKLEQL